MRLPRLFLIRSSLVVFGALLLTACDTGSVDSDGAFMGLSFAETGDATVPFVAVHEDGEVLGIFADPATGAITNATLLGDHGEELSVTIAPDGTPQRLVVEDYVFVFENVRATEADVVVITPAGTIHVARNVQMADGGRMASIQKAMAGGGNEVARAAQAASLGISIASCLVVSTMAVTGTFVTLGIAAPATAAIIFGCGSAVVSVIAEHQRLHGSDGTLFQQGDGAFSRISNSLNVLGCVGLNPEACVQTVLAAIQIAFSEGEVTVDQYHELIEQAEAILQNGGGDVQVSLTWNTTADIDLWVTDPAGERIYFGHRTSASGGQLDVDDRNGFGPENVFWPTGGAPTGSYQVQVDHWSGASPTNWTVTTIVRGVTRTFNGTLTSDQTSVVTSFAATGGSIVEPMTQAELASSQGVATK